MTFIILDSGHQTLFRLTVDPLKTIDNRKSTESNIIKKLTVFKYRASIAVMVDFFYLSTCYWSVNLSSFHNGNSLNHIIISYLQRIINISIEDRRSMTRNFIYWKTMFTSWIIIWLLPIQVTHSLNKRKEEL